MKSRFTVVFFLQIVVFFLHLVVDYTDKIPYTILQRYDKS